MDMRKLFTMAILPAAALAFLLAALLLVAPSCDQVRASLGKPTSADLEAIRAERAAEHERAVKDSLAAEEQARLQAAQAAADSAAASAVLKRYYAVAGAFKEASGAKIYEDKLRENGFRVRTFDFRSGLKVVCVEGSDSLEAVRRDMTALKKLGIAPSDPWIYNTNQKLHKEI